MATDAATLSLTTAAAAAATTIAAATTTADAAADRLSVSLKKHSRLNFGGFSPVVYYMQKYKHCAIFPIRYQIGKTRLLKKYLFK